MIRPSDCDLKYHFVPKVLEYGRKKLYLARFPQLAFVMTSPLKQIINKLPDPEELLNLLDLGFVATYLFCAAAEKLG